MNRLFSVKNLFSLFLVIWFAYGLWDARNYAFLAKIFPFYISLVLLIFAVAGIVLEIRSTVDKAEDLHKRSSRSDLSIDWDIPEKVVWRRFGLYLGIIIGLYLFIYLIGYPLAIMVFIFLFYRLIAKASWLSSIIAGAAGLGFLALASKVLNMSWPEGLIHLPWPFG